MLAYVLKEVWIIRELNKMGKVRFKDYLIDILSGKADISAKVVENISLITNIAPDYIYKIESNYIKFIDVQDKMEIIKDILKFLRVTSPEKVLKIEQVAYYKTRNDKNELLPLWLEKCYRETLKQTVGEHNKENIDKLVKYIIECAKNNEFKEEHLIKEYNEKGIYLVICDDIPGAKIRGAFKVHRGIPAIYLTHKHHRIADIYFALLHEWAHCKTNLNKAQSTSLVAYEDGKDKLELQADEQAFEWMVPNKYYTQVCIDNRYNVNEYQKYNRILKC